MIVLLRLEAEASDLETVVKDLAASEAAIRKLFKAADLGVHDEHYERCVGASPFFKGRRVLKYKGPRLEWQPKRQPFYAQSGSATNPVSITYTSATA